MRYQSLLWCPIRILCREQRSQYGLLDALLARTRRHCPPTRLWLMLLRQSLVLHVYDASGGRLTEPEMLMLLG